MGLNVTKEEYLAVYNKGMELMQKACSYQEYINAAEIFESIKDYEDSSTYAYNCRKQAVESRNSMLYLKARNEMDKGDAAGYSTALHYLKEIAGWKDADDLTKVCQEMFNKLNNPDAAASNVTAPISAAASEEEDQFFLETQNNLSLFNDSIFEESIPQIKPIDRAPQNNRKPGTKQVAKPVTKPVSKVNNSTKDTKNTKEKGKKKSVSTIVIIIAFAAICIVGVVYLIFGVIKPMMAYDDAIALIEEGKYDEGYAMLLDIGRDDYVIQNRHDRAEKALESKDYKTAVELLKANEEYDYIFDKMIEISDSLVENKQYLDAYNAVKLCFDIDGFESIRLSKATEYVDGGAYDKAFILLKGLNNDESKVLRNKITLVPYELYFLDASVGDIVQFGSYDLDGNSDNGKETVEWRIADIVAGKYLLICNDIVDCKHFHPGLTATDYKNCSLRSILNLAIFQNMFNDSESSLVIQSDINYNCSVQYGGGSGVCASNLFLLSVDEFEKYINSEQFASINRHGFSSSEYSQHIWLRDINEVEDTNASSDDDNTQEHSYQLGVCFVDDAGKVNRSGEECTTQNLILPAMWVKANN